MTVPAHARRRASGAAGARALAVEPDWLLLDEPMAHLDGPLRVDLYELLRDAIATTSAGVLLATHHPREAMGLADELAVLVAGRLPDLPG